MNPFSHAWLVGLLHHYGYGALCAIIGLECIGLPLPGETLLVGASVFAGTTHQINIVLVMLAAAGGSIVGQAAAFLIGRSLGVALLHRYGRYIGLTPPRLMLGQELFRRHGCKVIVIGRFVAILRSVAGLLAGVSEMTWSRFMMANIVGSVAWAGLYGVGGYTLGHTMKEIAGPMSMVLGAIGIIALVGAVLLVRRHEQRMIAELMARGSHHKPF